MSPSEAPALGFCSTDLGKSEPHRLSVPIAIFWQHVFPATFWPAERLYLAPWCGAHRISLMPESNSRHPTSKAGRASRKHPLFSPAFQAEYGLNFTIN